MTMTSNQLYTMAHNLFSEAKLKGLTPANPVSIVLLGSYLQGELTAPRRRFIVSYVQPPFPTDEIQVWLNPINTTFNISDMASQSWMHIYSQLDMWSVSPPAYTSASHSTLKAAVQTRSEIAGIDVANIGDASLIYVENDNAIWAYDAQSTEAASATVVVPNTGVGRWRVVTSSSGVLGNLDGGSF